MRDMRVRDNETTPDSRQYALFLFWPVLCCSLVFVTGCAHLPFWHPGDKKAEIERYEVQTIGDLTKVANAEPILVGGLGLVVGLEGTGGDAPPDLRKELEKQLKKDGVDNPRGILASKDNSLVIVAAQIPPGARKGDALDLEVTLPPQSKTSSLRGGVLKECVLFNYSSVGGAKGDQALRGHPLVTAAGPVATDCGEGDESTRVKQGHVWGGGRCNIDRCFYLTLNDDQQHVLIAKEVADCINRTLTGRAGIGRRGNGHGRAFRRQSSCPARRAGTIPAQLAPLLAGGASDADERRRQENRGRPVKCRRDRGRQRLPRPPGTRPARSGTHRNRGTALEALGSESMPGVAARSGERVPAGQVLLGGGARLSGLSCMCRGTGPPERRAACLACLLPDGPGLAGRGDRACAIAWSAWFAASRPPLRRAFRALRKLDEHDPAVQGKMLSQHLVAPGSPGEYAPGTCLNQPACGGRSLRHCSGLAATVFLARRRVHFQVG